MAERLSGWPEKSISGMNGDAFCMAEMLARLDSAEKGMIKWL